jgi:hypothetical protein
LKSQNSIVVDVTITTQYRGDIQAVFSTGSAIDQPKRILKAEF